MQGHNQLLDLGVLRLWGLNGQTYSHSKREQCKQGKESFHDFMVLKPKDKHDISRFVPRRSHRLGTGKGRGDDMAVLVLILPHRPLSQGFRVLLGQPTECLLQFPCEQSSIKTHPVQNGLAKFQHRCHVLWVAKCTRRSHSCHNECQQTSKCAWGSWRNFALE